MQYQAGSPSPAVCTCRPATSHGRRIARAVGSTDPPDPSTSHLEEHARKGLQGKVAVVTGGSSGIRQAIAIRLCEEGVDVAINYVGRQEGSWIDNPVTQAGSECAGHDRPTRVGA